MDHLSGKILLDPTVSKGQLSIPEHANKYEKTSFLMREYGLRVKKALSENK